MLRNKAFVKIFSSGLQALAVQVLGSVFFYLISVYLSKDSFGAISWMNALSIFITTILGFGLEQVVVRRIAASGRSDWAAAAFLFHSIAAFFTALLVLLLLSMLVKDSAGIYRILPWFFVAQGLLFIGIPLKQYLNAKEKFTPYGIIAVITNSARIVAAVWLIDNKQLEVSTIVTAMICTAVVELLALLIYIITKTGFVFKVRFQAYKKLLKEASAQYVSVIFDMSLSRMDWLLLGFMASKAVLADYSFAYRAYELSRLPMLIIAPVILPRLARLMAVKINTGFEERVNAFNRVELFLAMLITLILNILWTPLVGLITAGKYGATNATEFLILSACIPLQFFINLLWSVSFSAKKYKTVSTITVACATANIGLNLVAIPLLGGIGSALAFLATNLLQAFLYYRLVNKQVMKIGLLPFGFFLVAALAAWFVSGLLVVHFTIRLLLAMFVYITAALITKQLNKKHLQNSKQFLAR
ncbi:lipid II flippase MurJ [Mucilaginibacter celer]|uniref:lipid II flippase MurJ n=1 Tax=Mucilaginibacter celer TaxID=2305508 RepID=UPI0013CF0C32|nr:lipid II flippase MurJ [Mucilaginibacter celer]